MLSLYGADTSYLSKHPTKSLFTVTSIEPSDGIEMGSRNLSTSVSFAKDVINNVVSRLDRFTDSALDTLEKSMGMKLRKDKGIHLAGGPDFCMEIRRYSLHKEPAAEEIADVSEVISAEQKMPVVPETEVSYDYIITADDIHEEIQPVTEEIAEIPAEMPCDIIEENTSEVVCAADDGISSYGAEAEETVIGDDSGMISVPMQFEEAKTSSMAEELPAYGFVFEEPVIEAEPVDDGIDFEDLYETIVAESIINDIMPVLVPEVYREPVDDGVDFDDLYKSIVAASVFNDIMPVLVPEVFEEPYIPEYVISEFEEPVTEETVIDVLARYVPEYVISEFGESAVQETVLEVPVKFTPEYVISEFGESIAEETAIEVPVKSVPEYVIAETAEPVSEEISVDVPEKVQETAVSPFADPVTTTTSFRFSFASTSSVPGKTGFTFRMGKKKSIEEFINGPEQRVGKSSNSESAVLADSCDNSGMTLN